MKINRLLSLFRHFDLAIVFISTYLFLFFTSSPQKTNFYSLQNSIVENLVNYHSFGFTGTRYSPDSEYAYNTQSRTSQFQLLGDVFPYGHKFYPMKQYPAHLYSSAIYFLLNKIGLSFENNFSLTAYILLITSTSVLAAIGVSLIYKLAVSEKLNQFQAILITFITVLGTPLSGNLNVRNEEAFGYWILIIGILLTFFPTRSWQRVCFQLFLIYLAAASLPIALILLPVTLLRIYLTGGKRYIWKFITVNLIGIIFLFLPNWLLFREIALSIYQVGAKIVPTYNRSFPILDMTNFQSKINFYFLNPQTSILVNYPILLIFLIGLIKSSLTKFEKFSFAATSLFFIVYLTLIKEDGWLGLGAGRFSQGLFALTLFGVVFFVKNKGFLPQISFYLAAVSSIITGLIFYFSPPSSLTVLPKIPLISWPLFIQIKTILLFFLLGAIVL